jgi:predicted RND superfamily exporter protein
VVFFPLLILMVIAVFALFRSLKALVAALSLIAISVGVAYGFVRFLGIQDSPLLLLIPVFSLGLLSDYGIHYFYHHFHVSGLDTMDGPRKALMFPLSLTAISTVTGFVSLSLINGSGHLQVGLLIALAVVVTWFGLFFWLDYCSYPAQNRELMAGFQRAQAKLFAAVARHRFILFGFLTLAVIWGVVQLGKLSIEPYPIEQLPDTTTVKKADLKINDRFYGTVPFFIEVDTGEKLGILHKESLLALQDMHNLFESENIGYAFSVLSVLKRMNLYFMGDEESLLAGNQFDDMYDTLIEQYLLYYSSGVDPLDYESLLDNSYRVFSIKGLAYYRNYQDLDHFNALISTIESGLPSGWSLKVHGMVSQLAEEQYKLANNWIMSFAGGSLLIFLTVLVYYRKLRMALISLIPGVISMIISFGFIGMAGISIDAFSIIFVAIITGLVIDYSIHTLAALEKIPEITSLEDGFSQIMGYSGIPIFLSFLTSLLSFSVLFLSSFQGARNLGFLLFTSLVLSFFLSLYLLPLLVLPGRMKNLHLGEKSA